MFRGFDLVRLREERLGASCWAGASGFGVGGGQVEVELWFRVPVEVAWVPVRGAVWVTVGLSGNAGLTMVLDMTSLLPPFDLAGTLVITGSSKSSQSSSGFNRFGRCFTFRTRCKLTHSYFFVARLRTFRIKPSGLASITSKSGIQGETFVAPEASGR